MAEMDLYLAELCGIHAGDGYMRIRERNKGEIDISGNIEEKEYYDSHVIPMFNKLFGLNIKGKEFSRKTYGFVCYDKAPRDALIAAGFPSGKKTKTVRAPDSILNNPNKELSCAFLRGLFDTDGNLFFRKTYAGISNFKRSFSHYPVISLVTISKGLAEDIIKILHNFDIVFNYYVYDSRMPNNNRRYTITINGLDGLEKWMKLVGSKNIVKMSRYLVWKKLGYCPSKTTLAQRQDILNGKTNL